MNKNEYFLECLKNNLHFKKSWVISIFSVFEENASYHDNNYDYKLSKIGDSYYYLLNGKNILIEDSVHSDPKSSFLNLKDKITVTNDICPNVTGKIESTYARLLFNLLVLVKPFGTKIPYINSKTSVGAIETIIADRLSDTLDGVKENDNKHIYVDEYLAFCDSLTYLSGMMTLFVWAETPKLLLPPTGIKEFKDKLIKENKDHLDDPNTIVKIEKELIKFDNEYLKGDPGGEYFADSKKSRNIVRKKLFLMYGMDSTEPGVFSKPVINSLEEGWDINNFPQMNDALRAGSYGRGFETQLGGELSKWLLRASAVIRIQKEDCNTKLGMSLLVSKDNYEGLVKLYYFNEKMENVMINNMEEAKSLIGKEILLRTAMYCKCKVPDLCQYCVGEKLAINPTALSSAIADFGSVILNIALAKFHGKSIGSTPFKMNLLT